MKRTALAVAIGAMLAAAEAGAVRLNPEGMGQALIFPYYTARSAGNGSFNTYVSVVNHTRLAKALRVHVREGRLGRVVSSFNLFLAPNDVWTGAVVPTAEGARWVTSDVSCTEPQFAGGAVRAADFDDRAYASTPDGAGSGLDRTREGYIEMLELGTLTGASASAVTHVSTGLPANCALVQPPATLQVEAPTGGLSGTLTLIDVTRGMDFTVGAEALDDLARAPYYRPSADPYPGLGAAEIDRVSTVAHNGFLYRSEWQYSVDAVSAVLMRNPVFEYTVETGTRSATDMVLTFPTWHLHANESGAGAPFTFARRWSEGCRTSAGLPEPVLIAQFNRDERGQFLSSGEHSPGCSFNGPCSTDRVCSSATVATIANAGDTIAFDGPTMVLGSTTKGLAGEGMPGGTFLVSRSFRAGWISVQAGRSSPYWLLSSLPSSTRTNLATGEMTTGAHNFRGTPVTGFAVRTFQNGTLDCAGSACQGNFGGAFPFRYTRSISP